MLLAKPVWKPRGHEESEDLTDFHLNAFRVFLRFFAKTHGYSVQHGRDAMKNDSFRAVFPRKEGQKCERNHSRVVG